MPPRRSNRLSVEPPEQPPVLSKRSKRGLSVDVEEKENDELSTTGSTRSRRGSSAAPAVSGTKRKVSGRAKNDLSDVQESADEEENPETPVKKKPRPSTSDDEEFDATPKPKPKRGKATSRKPSSKVPPPPRPQTPPPPSAAEIHELEDEDVAFLETPTKRTPRRSKAKPPPRGEPEDEEEDNATSLLDHTQSVPRPIRSSPVKSQPTMPKEPEGPKARLVIHKMALVNFKSYAGRQEIGPFHKSFSAIVGPNGSGKSNTIDALLFVFGYRANKMRQSKLSELIHNSARFPDLEFCTVEVHFREIIDLATTDGFETVPNSDLVVARTALRDNKSSYTVNGRTKKYNEVRGPSEGQRHRPRPQPVPHPYRVKSSPSLKCLPSPPSGPR
ncbi:RecF/RecN/SMC N terminal domain-containing protein [Flagelloscypha sp. PMI_526]|nr:RecF/RecN/SMC N terminal domain-containing protein [Flagelloscypha sp. PMI_526]